MKERKPPKSALWLLHLFCSEERIEEIEGDLIEIFHERSQHMNNSLAKLSFWWMVFRSFRRYALKNSKSKLLNDMQAFFLMFKHHFTISARQMWKYRTTSAINVIGLAIGLATFISIISIVLHEHSYNKHIPEKESIYRLYSEFSGVFSGTNRGVAAGVAPFFKENHPEAIAAISGFHTREFAVKSTTNEKVSEFRNQNVVITDPSFFEVFGQYDWLIGAQESALKQPNNVVLTLSQAEKYFGKRPLEQYLNTRLQYDDSLTVTVSGIVQQFSGNTDFVFGDFISLETVKNSWLKKRIDLSNWNNTNSSSQLWIKATTALSMEEQTNILQPLNFKSEELAEDKDWIRSFALAPLTDMHFDQTLSLFDNRGRGAANLQTLSIMTFVSFALLALAIINFVNLEVAQLRSKMKEVGVRKVMGGHHSQLVHRFLTSSFLTTSLAGLLAIPLSYFGGLLFESFLPTSVISILNDMYFLWVIVITIVIVALAAGFYPALVFARFSPAEAFASKRTQQSNQDSNFVLRKALVSFQFVCSQLLIVGSLIVYIQLDFMQNKDVGFQTENIMYINNPWNAPDKNYDILLNKIKEIPELSEVVTQQSPPASNNYSSTLVTFKTDTSEITHDVYKKWGAENYLDFYGIKILAGRPVSPSENIKEMIINDTFRKMLGFATPEDALGIMLDLSDELFQVTGVMTDFHNFSMVHEMQPLLFEYSDTKYGIAGKFKPDNLHPMIEKVTDAFQQVYPNQSLEIEFQEQTLLKFYESETQMAKLTGYATGIAILISCMGLFGMISLTIENKTKEIGIRKVLGANMLSIARIISQEFLILLLISFIICVPLIYYYGTEWLSNYAYAISLSWWLYALGGLITLMIAASVTATKVIQATRTNPVSCLRYE